MDIIVTSAANVPEMQKNLGITKILSLLEPEYPMIYQWPHNSQITRLNMVDATSDPELKEDHYLAPNKRHIQDIIDFANNLQENDKVIIHCYAGISRSTASYLIVMYYWTCDFKKCTESLLKMRPYARPNRMLCRLADEYFDTGTMFYDFAKSIWDSYEEKR